jgi:hypothetical protein
MGKIKGLMAKFLYKIFDLGDVCVVRIFGIM